MQLRVVAVTATMIGITAGCGLILGIDRLEGADAMTPADAGDATARGYCASLSPQPLFCADFDDASDLAYGFMPGQWALGYPDAGTLSIVKDFAKSPPHSVRMAMTPSTNGCGYTELTQTWANVMATSGHLAFDVRIGNADGGSPPVPVGVASLQLILGPTLCQVFIWGDGPMSGFAEQDYFADGGTYYNQANLVRWPVPGNWWHVDLELSTGPSPNVKILVNNDSAIDGVWALNSECAIVASTVTLGIGFRCDQVPAPAEQRFDNVTFDWK